MPMRCDNAREILVDMSAHFIQFREVLLAMEGKAEANGWAVQMSFCAQLAQRVNGCCRMEHTITFSRELRSVTACSCPRKGLPKNRARGRKRLRLAKPTRTGSHGRGEPKTPLLGRGITCFASRHWYFKSGGCRPTMECARQSCLRNVRTVRVLEALLYSVLRSTRACTGDCRRRHLHCRAQP